MADALLAAWDCPLLLGACPVGVGLEVLGVGAVALFPADLWPVSLADSGGPVARGGASTDLPAPCASRAAAMSPGVRPTPARSTNLSSLRIILM